MWSIFVILQIPSHLDSCPIHIETGNFQFDMAEI